jgi:hypothetical protein
VSGVYLITSVHACWGNSLATFTVLVLIRSAQLAGSVAIYLSCSQTVAVYDQVHLRLLVCVTVAVETWLRRMPREAVHAIEAYVRALRGTELRRCALMPSPRVVVQWLSLPACRH